MMLELRPQPGPQELFLSTSADVCVYGGAAGGGKTFGSILDVARYVGVPGFNAVFFRRTYPELAAPDGIWDLSTSILPGLGCRPVHGDMDWHLPRGGRIIMRHLQHLKDVYTHQGAQYCGIYYDELTHFLAQQFWYMFSRNRSTCGVRPFIRAGTNPDPDSFVADLIAWWLDDNGDAISERSGVVRWFVRLPDDRLDWADTQSDLRARHPGGPEPVSFTFISASLDDNPALTSRDPGYRARLETLPYVERARLLGGNWKVRPAAGSYFKRSYFPVFDEVPGKVVASVRGWDKAATKPHEGNRDPDWTRGVRLLRLSQDAPVRYLVADVASIRDGPGPVDRLMRTVASQDGRDTTVAAWLDPGQAGKVDARATRHNLDGYSVSVIPASKSKETYAGPVSSAAEAGLIGLLRGPWNDAFLREVESFPEGKHDDIVDGLSLAYMRLSSGTKKVVPPDMASSKGRWRV